MQKFHIDLTGPHVRSKNGHTYLLTGICSFSKYLVAVPLRDKTALSVARALVKHVYLVYGAAEIQVHDQGREFCNEISEKMAKLWGIQEARTSPYRPSSNGVVERVHATINGVFAKTIKENQRDWCERTPYVAFAYNTSYHTSTTYSPFYLMFLREPVVGLDLMLGTPSEVLSTNLEDYTGEMSQRMRDSYALVRELLQSSFSRMKRRYDSRIKELQLEAGDFVWYYSPRKRPGLGRKWQMTSTGPYQVVRRVNWVNYVISLTPRSRPVMVHIDRLKKYEGTLPTCWTRHKQTEKDAADSADSESTRHAEGGDENLFGKMDCSGNVHRRSGDYGTDLNEKRSEGEDGSTADVPRRSGRKTRLPFRFRRGTIFQPMASSPENTQHSSSQRRVIEGDDEWGPGRLL